MMIYLLFVIPGLVLGIYAQIKLKSTFGRYRKEPISNGITGAQAARAILDDAGLSGMPIEQVPGELTDHYDPMKKKLCLSPEVYQGRSLASVGVAAHEAGHALQHKAAYGFFQLRMLVVPATQLASKAHMPIFLLGLFGIIAWKIALPLIVAIFGVITLFQVITLPVEFDASSRAKKELQRLGLVASGESRGVSKVLNAAALTYVAAMISSAGQLLYYVMLMNRDD
jgi:Zn-dependent membrane protease YugP